MPDKGDKMDTTLRTTVTRHDGTAEPLIDGYRYTGSHPELGRAADFASVCE